MILDCGRITAVEDLGVEVSGPVLEAGDAVAFPGLVDTHVHINDPGRSDWEGFETATRSAAAGGVTTVVDMPLNSLPPTTSVKGLKAKVAAAEGSCFVDVALWGGCVPESCADNGGGLIELAGAGVRGFKAFLCDSGVEEFRPVSFEILRSIAPVLRELDLPLLVHAEHPDEVLPARGDPDSYASWLRSRPQAAEAAAIRELIGLSRDTGVRIHIVHLAADEALATLRQAREEGVAITVETCPHYLTFTSNEIADADTRFKCAPPIRGEKTREALWQALIDGLIDQVSTDHSPCTPQLKSGDFVTAWGGIASLQLLLSVVWTGARVRGVRVERLTEWLATAPARLAGLGSRKGSIRRGADADFVIWQPEATFTVKGDTLCHRHPVCAYEGRKLYGVVEQTLLRGRTVFAHDEPVGPAQGSLIR